MDDQTATEAARDEAAKTSATAHPDAYEGVTPIKVNKIGHMVYEVSDVERSARFWTEVMGFEESDRNDIGMVFFRCGPDHHAIGLKPGKTKRRPDAGAGLNVEHLAFEVDNADVLLKAREYLKQNDIAVVFEGRKGAGSNISLHFLDPDGYEFELYCHMDQTDESGRSRPPDQYHRAKSLEEAITHPLPETW